jgi:hypothetical protein
LIQGAILAILGITLAGYMFSSTFIITKYRVPKFQGHHLLYKCLFNGAIFFILSLILFTSTWPITSQWSFLFNWTLTALPSLTQQQFNVSIILIDAILLAILVAKYLNRIILVDYNNSFNDEKNDSNGNEFKLATLDDVEEKNNSIDKRYLRSDTDRRFEMDVYCDSSDSSYISHVMSCFIEPSFLLLTLENRRCYVCIPYEIKTPKDHQEEQDLTIIPVATGYRDEADLCLELTTYYYEIINILKMDKEQYTTQTKAQKEELKKALFNHRVTIPHGQIVSIGSFDLAKYKQFKNEENKRRNEIRTGREENTEISEHIINP